MLMLLKKGNFITFKMNIFINADYSSLKFFGGMQIQILNFLFLSA
jgi:hypothetical protein